MPGLTLWQKWGEYVHLIQSTPWRRPWYWRGEAVQTERSWFAARRVVDAPAVSIKLRWQKDDDGRRGRDDDDDAQPMYSEKFAANQIACVRLVMTTAIRWPCPAAGLLASVSDELRWCSGFTAYTHTPPHTSSASTSALVVPPTRRTTVGNRAFPVDGARVWNALPSFVTDSATITIFKRHLITYHLLMRSLCVALLWLCSVFSKLIMPRP